jgi:hypothetical protein
LFFTTLKAAECGRVLCTRYEGFLSGEGNMKFIKKLLLAVFMVVVSVQQSQLQAGVKDDFKKLVTFIKAIGVQLKKDLKVEHKIYLRNLIDAAGIKASDIPAPLAKFLDSIEFQTPKLRIDQDTYELTWDEALVVGIKYKLQTRLYVGPSKDGKSSGFSLSIGLPGKNTLNTLFPDIKANLKKSQDALPDNVRKMMQEAHLTVDDFAKIVDWLEFEDMAFIIGSHFDDPVWGEILTGANLHSTIRFVGPLQQITDMLGKDLTTVQARGVVTLTLGGSEIRAIYPGKFTLFRWPLDPKVNPFFHVRTTGLEARVGLTMSSSWLTGIYVLTIKFISGLDIKLPFQNDYVAFKGSIDVMPIGTTGQPAFEVAGWMDGMVNNMFGLPGFDLGNIGFGMTLPCAIFAGELVPLGVSLKGEVHIGPLKPSCAVSIDVAKPQVVGVAKLPAMSHQDFIDWIIQLAQSVVSLGKGKIDVAALKAGLSAGIPPFKFSDLEFYFMPSAAEIFDTRYSTGIYIKGNGEIFGLSGGFQAAAYYFGLKSVLYLNEIKIPQQNPFIIISGTDKAKDSLAKMDGPTMTGEISPSKKTEYGSKNDIDFKKGPIVLGELSFSRQLLYMDGMLKIPALGIESYSHIIINPTNIECDLKNKLGGVYDTEFHLKGNPLKPETFWVSGFINQQGLGALGQLLQQAAKDFSDKANKDLDAAQKNVIAWQKQAEKDIDTWITLQVINVDKQINGLLSRIQAADLRCRTSDFWHLIPNCAEEILVPGYWLEVGVLEVHKEVTLKGVMREIAKSGVRFASTSAQLGIGVAKIGVEFARATTDFAGKLLANGFNITRVTLDGSVKELSEKGLMPKVEVEGIILGKSFKQVYQINFKKPEMFAAQIVTGLAQVFGPQPQPYKKIVV